MNLQVSLNTSDVSSPQKKTPKHPNKFRELLKPLADLGSRLVMMQSLFKTRRYQALGLNFWKESLESQYCLSLNFSKSCTLKEIRCCYQPQPGQFKGPEPGLGAHWSLSAGAQPGAAASTVTTVPLVTKRTVWVGVTPSIWEKIGCSCRETGLAWCPVYLLTPNGSFSLKVLKICLWSHCKTCSELYSYVGHGNRFSFPKASNLNLVVPDHIPRPKTIPTHLLLPK